MRIRFAVLLFLFSSLAFSQQAPKPAAPAAAPAATAPAATPTAACTHPPQAPNRAEAYYHYMLAHMYEELGAYERNDYNNKAIDEYRQAIAADPSSEFLDTELAELYVRTGRIREAVLEAQDILKCDPNNIGAHKLLGRIYLRSLGDMQAGAQSQNLLGLAIEQYQEIARLEPTAENHLMLGRLFRLSGDMVKAENEFQTAIRLDPNSEEAVSNLAYLYNEENDYKHAIDTLKAVPEAARSAKVYAALGYTYEQEKDYKQAIAAYRKAVELDKDNLDSVRGLAQNLLNDGQVDAALEQYRAIAAADPQDPQTYLRLAEIYRRTGQFDSALDALQKAAALIPNSLEVPYNMALVYDSQGRFADAVEKLQGLLQQTAKPDGSYSPGGQANRGIFLERLGGVYREMNQPQQAVDSFRQMLALGDDNASRGYQEIIETYREQKQWSQATATAQEAVAKLPKDRNLKMVLASQLGDSGQPEAAIAQLKGMLQGTPDDRDVYLNLAQINTRVRRWQDAEAALQQADRLSLRPEDVDYDNFLWGALYERQKMYERAEEMFKKVLADDPRNAATLNYLGYMLADRGQRLDEALGYIQKAVQLDPQNGAYLDSLGWAYFKMGNYDLAEVNLRKALEHMGNDGTVQDHMAELYQKTGRLKQAVAHWELALQEWNKSLPADVDAADVTRAQKLLESTKMKLAQESGAQKQ